MIANLFSRLAKNPKDKGLSPYDQRGLQLLDIMKNREITKISVEEILKFIKSNQFSGVNAINFNISDAENIYTPSILARTKFANTAVQQLIKDIQYKERNAVKYKDNPLMAGLTAI
jgi:hypothetical protein